MNSESMATPMYVDVTLPQSLVGVNQFMIIDAHMAAGERVEVICRSASQLQVLPSSQQRYGSLEFQLTLRFCTGDIEAKAVRHETPFSGQDHVAAFKHAKALLMFTQLEEVCFACRQSLQRHVLTFT